ncbi:hypothetical protein PDESU_03346 [Pontiella desulfatans]|uniref:CopG-like ribbon-helix-helix domain-containing protein n=1 Tax=Pontiella desulfatans TaxID=2750659 RepID=A0A6C2U4M9_PONDE|nr:ribbon-helix-helix protein, CopG family [Pontiella desulfatans]VGO14777.1 hypothetical protein PDESU_03346 [Pontiella desulfatans]
MAKSQDEESGKTNISITLPRELIKQLDVISRQEQRSRSNMIAVMCEEIIQKKKMQTV